MAANLANQTPQGGDGVAVIDENDRIINSMQSMRENFISQLTKDGKFPACMEDRSAILQLMDGATRTALANKKIKADEKNAVSQTQIVKNLAEVIRIASSNRAARRREGLNTLREVPVVEVKKVKDHTAIGTLPVTTATVYTPAGESGSEEE